MSPEAAAISKAILAAAEAQGIDPVEQLRRWLARDAAERELRLSRHERQLRLVSA